MKKEPGVLRSNYKEVKNYLYNDCGITKEFIRQVIREIVQEEIQKHSVKQDIIQNKIDHFVEDAVLKALGRERYNGKLSLDAHAEIHRKTTDYVARYVTKMIDIQLLVKKEE